MKPDLEILKSLYLPEFQRLPSFATTLANEVDRDSFWDYFNQLVLNANDVETVLTGFLNKYNISTSEQTIVRLDRIRKEYISQLASIYCNNQTNPSIELLLQNQNQDFTEEVAFIKDINTAIINTERQRLKKKLSFTDEMLDFEIADSEITSAFRAIERKALKEKIKAWDQEPVVEHKQIKLEPIVSKVEKKTRSIPLSYFRYAVAACFVGAMVWIGVRFYNTQPKENNLAVNKPDTTKTPPVVTQVPEFAKTEVKENIQPLMQEHGLGYAQATTKIKIVVTNLKPRIASIEKYIAENEAGTNTQHKRYSSIQSELDSLKGLITCYTFNGKSLQVIINTDNSFKTEVLKTSDNHFYYKEGDHYFTLQLTDKPLPFIIVTDKPLIEKLDKIEFDNKK